MFHIDLCFVSEPFDRIEKVMEQTRRARTFSDKLLLKGSSAARFYQDSLGVGGVLRALSRCDRSRMRRKPRQLCQGRWELLRRFPIPGASGKAWPEAVRITPDRAPIDAEQGSGTSWSTSWLWLKDFIVIYS